MKVLTIIPAIFLLSVYCDSGKLEYKKNISSQINDTLSIQNKTHTAIQLDSVPRAGKLTGKTIIIDVTYSAIECECAQWVETKYLKGKLIDNLPEAERFYLEPSNKNLPDADALWDGEHLPLQLKLTGQFYKSKGLPLYYKRSKGSPDSARIFRYEKIKIISPYYRKALGKAKST